MPIHIRTLGLRLAISWAEKGPSPSFSAKMRNAWISCQYISISSFLAGSVSRRKSLSRSRCCHFNIGNCASPVPGGTSVLYQNVASPWIAGFLKCEKFRSGMSFTGIVSSVNNILIATPRSCLMITIKRPSGVQAKYLQWASTMSSSLLPLLFKSFLSRITSMQVTSRSIHPWERAVNRPPKQYIRPSIWEKMASKMFEA